MKLSAIRRFARLTVMAAAIPMAVAPATAHAQAQSYPNKPIKLIVAFPAGGDIDPVARALGEHFQSAWGQPNVVDFKPGAGAILGTDYVAKSPPDGYTLLLCSIGAMTINPGLYPKLPYNVEKDIEPISLIATTPMVLVVNRTVPATRFSEFLAYAKANPGKLTYASAGTGNVTHLTAALFASVTGLKMVHVPYKGSAPALNDLLGGHVSMYFNPLPSARGYLKASSDKVTPLAVTTLKRSAHLPDVPTLDELGVKGFDVKSWYGLCAPGGTPKDIVQKLNAEVGRALAGTSFPERLRSLGTDPSPTTVEQFTHMIRAETVQWAKTIREQGVKVD